MRYYHSLPPRLGGEAVARDLANRGSGALQYVTARNYPSHCIASISETPSNGDSMIHHVVKTTVVERCRAALQ
jgi:hypothetical protein